MNNELNRAIATAKKAHDHNDGPADATAVSIGALIRAVEILADQLKDEHVGTYHPPMIAEIKTQDEPGDRTHDSAPNATPAPNLVERLKKAYVFAEMEAIAGGGDPVDLGVRAILAELAKMPVELPSEEQIRIASYDIGNADGVMTLGAAGQRVATLFQERLAPILAAKDAEREALNKACLDAVSAAASAEHRLDLAKERIVELEKQRDDGVTGDPQPANSDTTGVEPDWIVERVRSAIKSSYEDLELLKGPFLAVSFRDMAERAIAELRRVDKERELVTIDGKTPGQTLRSSLGAILRAGNDVDERLEQAGQAVLRAFGQPSQTQQTNAVEALRRVHSAIKHSLSLLPYNTSFMNGVAVVRKDNVEKNVQRTFDAEIAKLGTEPPSKATTPTFFVNENGLRGSYFCTQFPFRPFLHIGHDIEFDDIPRILKLGRNDIIEVRVVERAKQ